MENPGWSKTKWDASELPALSPNRGREPVGCLSRHASAGLD